MAQPAPRLPTFEELYAQIARLPAGITGEILDPGVLRTMSRPGRAHGRAAKQCLRALGRADVEDGGSGWWILAEPEIRLPGNRLSVPGLAGWRVARVPELPDENPIAILPDWCCEVLSPTTARADRTEKLPLYAANGVEWVWLVDPVVRTVEIFETVARRATLAVTARDDDARTLPPFDGAMALAGWWMPEKERAGATAQKTARASRPRRR